MSEAAHRVGFRVHFACPTSGRRTAGAEWFLIAADRVVARPGIRRFRPRPLYRR
jgi:hypothetical protein